MGAGTARIVVSASPALGGRLMAGHRFLVPGIGVRIPAPQLLVPSGYAAYKQQRYFPSLDGRARRRGDPRLHRPRRLPQALGLDRRRRRDDVLRPLGLPDRRRSRCARRSAAGELEPELVLHAGASSGSTPSTSRSSRLYCVLIFGLGFVPELPRPVREPAAVSTASASPSTSFFDDHAAGSRRARRTPARGRSGSRRSSTSCGRWSGSCCCARIFKARLRRYCFAARRASSRSRHARRRLRRATSSHLRVHHARA